MSKTFRNSNESRYHDGARKHNTNFYTGNGWYGKGSFDKQQAKKLAKHYRRTQKLLDAVDQDWE